MSQPRKWFIGLVPVAVLLAIAGLTRQAPTETDLIQRGNASLKDSGLEWAQVKLAGRDAVITGEAPDPSLRTLAVSAAERAFGVRLVKDQMTVLAEAKPFTLTATRDGARVVLSGFAARAAQKTAIAAAAKAAMPEATIVDELKLARGAPASFQAASTFGLGELAKLTQGTLSLSDQSLSLTGRAADLPKWNDVRGKLAALPAGVTLGKGLGEGDILAPIARPYTVQAEKTANGLVLTGHVPNAATRATVLAAANALGRPVTDRMQIADGAPATYVNNVDFGLAQLGRLDTGVMALSDSALSVTGRAATIANFNDVRTRIAALPQGMTLAKGLAEGDILPPLVRPYTVQAEKTAAGLVLTGHVPTAHMRSTVMAAANALGRPVTDRMQIADGAPATYVNNVDFGLSQLGRLDTGVMSLSDSALTITGRAATMPNFNDVRARLAALPQGMTLARAEIAPPIVRPFNFEAEKTAAGTVLTGYIPNEAARATLVAAANAAGAPVTDRLVVADGAPAGDFVGTGRALIGELGKLQNGKATLVDTQATITGLGQVGVTDDTVRANLRGLPQGFQLVRAQIEAGVIRPYLFNATRGDNAVTLTGFAPDQAAKTAIADQARRFFDGVRVDDQLVIGPGAPQGFANAARSGLQDLSRLLPGSSFSMSDQSVALRGLAPHDGARDQILGEFRGRIPSGFGSLAEINTAPPPPTEAQASVCQILFNDLMAGARINFNTGSAELAVESLGLLDRLVIVARRCDQAKVEISGHTDSDGSVAMNNDLSRRRAEAVAQYLVRAGVTAERLEAVGYGPARPVASNDTAEGKAKNRRIEFTVK